MDYEKEINFCVDKILAIATQNKEMFDIIQTQGRIIKSMDTQLDDLTAKLDGLTQQVKALTERVVTGSYAN